MNTEATFCNNRSIGLTNDRPISAASSSHSSHSSSSSSPTHFHRSSVPHHHRFGGGGGGGGGGAGSGGGPLNGSTTRGAPSLGHQHQRRPASPTLERVSHAGSPPPLKTDVSRQTGPESRVPGRETPVPPESRRWVPPSLRPQHGLTQEAQNDAVFRTVRGILNKLTPENFQKLSDDLLKIDLNSKVILNGVIHLLFEKALDEQKYSSMYAQLCKRLSVEAPNFDDGTAAASAGGAAAAAAANSGPAAAAADNKSSNNTFLTLLLNVCRDRFLNRNSIDHYSNSGSSLGTGAGGQTVVIQQNDAHLSDADLEEKLLIAKHKMLGNVKFIGELAKLDMLTDKRLHKCVQQLLDKNRSSSAKERCEDLECLSQLIRTCGANLDTVKGKVLMDQYFAQMERYSHSPKYPARIRFMLRDVIELRKRDWVPRKQTAEGPMPIDQLQSDDDHSRSPFGGGGRNQHGGGGRGNGGGGGHHHGGGGGGGGHHGHHHHHQHQHQHHGSAAGDQEPHNWMNKMSSMSLGGGGQGGHHGGDYGLSMTNSSHYSQPYNSSPGGGGGHYSNRDYRDSGRGGGGGGNMDYRHNNQRNNYNNHNSYGNNNSGGGGGNGYGSNQNSRYNNGNNNGSLGGGGNNGSKGGMMGSSHGGQHGNGIGGGTGYGQNANNMNAMNNKDLAPRFKRNLINAASTAAADPADALTFRPAANSLLFKANVNINAAQLPLVQQSRNSNGGLLGSNPNSLHNAGTAAGQQPYGSGTPGGHHHQDARLNPYGQNATTTLLSSNSSTSSSGHSADHPSAASSSPAVVSIASKLMPPQPVNNLLKKDQILIKQASLEKPKQTKKDKGPVKEDVLKRVQTFVVEHFVNAPAAADEEEEEEDEEDDATVDDGNETKANADAAQPESQTKQAADAQENGAEPQQPAAVVEVAVAAEPATPVAVAAKPPKAKIVPGAAQLAAFIDLKIPDKFMRDTMTTILDEIVDKPEPVHERVFQLLVALRRDGKLPTAAVLDGFRGVLKNDAIHPRIATHAATLLCRAVTTQLCRIQDVAQLADNGQHYPLFLLVLQQLHRQLGKQALLSAYAASKVQLMGTLPEPDRNKERMAAILQDRGLSYLYPLLKLQGELQKQIEADANPAQLYKWIKDNVDSTCYGDPGFITALMNVLLKYITQETTLAEGADRTKNPDKAVIVREKQLLERYCPVLQAFLRGQSDLELVAIYVLQTFCHASGFPKGMLLRWFTALYDLNVVEEESFLRWKEDLSDVYPGKGQALFQVNSYLTWLEQVDTEDEDDDDE